MKRNTKTLLAIATAAAFSLGTATAFSDPGHGRGGYGGMMGGPGRGMMKGPCPGGPMAGGAKGANATELTEARLERFRAQLGIRPDQEQAWKDFTEALAEPRAPQADARTFRGPGDRLAAVAERLGRLAEAANALYEKLDPPQRIAFDWLFRGMGRHRGF